MKRGLVFLTAGALLWSVVTSRVHAQRGMGDSSGVASQAIKPEVVNLLGEVLKVNTEPCEMSTGPADLGTHFLLKTPKGEELNVHLGPADRVAYVTEQLPLGENVTVNAFRTAKMPPNHYVAQSVTCDGTAIRLRDENLRPLWAGSTLQRGRGRAQWISRSGPSRARESLRTYGRRYGRRYGRGWGRRWRW